MRQAVPSDPVPPVLLKRKVYIAANASPQKDPATIPMKGSHLKPTLPASAMDARLAGIRMPKNLANVDMHTEHRSDTSRDKMRQ